MAGLRRRVGGIVADDAAKRRECSPEPVWRYFPDRLDAPLSVGKTRSFGSLNGRRSSQTASSSRSAGVRSTIRVPASVFDRSGDHQLSRKRLGACTVIHHSFSSP
jgi:hypothetical protein